MDVCISAAAIDVCQLAGAQASERRCANPLSEARAPSGEHMSPPNLPFPLVWPLPCLRSLPP